VQWSSLVNICDLIATFAFAAVGSRVAAAKGMDYGGIILIAAVSSLAGGTFRNLFLVHEPAWVLNPWLFASVLLAVFITIVLKRSEQVGRFMLALDTFGLAVATVSSTNYALGFHTTPVVAVILGVTGAVTGGLLRDVLSQTEPVLLHRETIGTSALAGAIVYVLLNEIHLNKAIPAIISGLVVVAVRELSIAYSWNLPRVKPSGDFK
jgi:uncharacterized membrane protein YeiH